MKFLMVLLLATGLMMATPLSAQRAALKTNLLYDATATFNLGIEVENGPRHTLDVSASYNPWTFSGGKKWKHWLLQPEFRHWFCEKWNGHFIGFHAHGGQYNAGGINIGIHLLGTDFRKLEHARYEGWFAGGGIAYGYSWMLGEHWNFELELGAGYSYSKFDRYECGRCSDRQASGHHHYFGLTKAAVSLLYVF